MEINITAMGLMLYAVSLICFAPMFHISVLAIIKPVAFPMSYILGYGLCNAKENGSVVSKRFFITVAVLAAGSLLHYLLNWLISDNADGRDSVDFWTRTALTATNQAAMASMAVGLAAALLLGSGIKWYYKLLGLAMLIAILAYNLVLSGRTLILMTAIALIVAAFYNIKENRRGRIIFIAGIAIAVLAVFYAYTQNLFDLRTTIENSMLFGRFTGEYGIELTEDSRLDHKLIFLQKILDYPMGGAHIRDMHGYAHDLFLDSYDEAGWIAIATIFAYFVSSVIRLLKLVYRKQIPFMVRLVALCMYITVYVEFWVEPVLQASPWLLASFCVMDGMVSIMLKNSRRQPGYAGGTTQNS